MSSVLFLRLTARRSVSICTKNGIFWVLRLVVLVRTDVSEELSVSFIRVTRIGEEGTHKFLRSVRRLLVTAMFLVHRFLSP
jgi:hypothetical protein